MKVDAISHAQKGFLPFKGYFEFLFSGFQKEK